MKLFCISHNYHYEIENVIKRSRAAAVIYTEKKEDAIKKVKEKQVNLI